MCIDSERKTNGNKVMKTSELMIGDYVLVKPSKMPIKIVAIHSETVAYHAYANRLIWVEKGLLEPIILTPRILSFSSK